MTRGFSTASIKVRRQGSSLEGGWSDSGRCALDTAARDEQPTRLDATALSCPHQGFARHKARLCKAKHERARGPWRNAGGGTRTPDTRIMIPADFGLSIGN